MKKQNEIYLMTHCKHCGRPISKCVCADFEGYQIEDLIDDMSRTDADPGL